jgi:NTP pyrophosphatase (non-canonical NTP hydrolase)
MRRFPDGNDPFRILTRLLEECGELAQQVNHFEDCGIKRQKHGEPDRDHLAKEIRDVLTAALDLAHHYGVYAELAASIDLVYARMQTEGLIVEEGQKPL